MTTRTADEKYDSPIQIEHPHVDHTQDDDLKGQQHVDLLLKSDLDHLSGWQTAWRFRKVSSANTMAYN